MILLETSQLSIGYPPPLWTKKPFIPVLEEIHIQALSGEIIGILGTNGSGKSTLLKTLAGLIPPFTGKITIKGENLNHISLPRRARIFASVFTKNPSTDFSSVLEWISRGRDPYTNFMGKFTETDYKIIYQTLQKLALLPLAHRPLEELSDGERQKVFLARALVQKPQILFLDEVTLHLDLKHKLEIIHLLKQLAHDSKVTIFLSLHEWELAFFLCDKVLLLKEARIFDSENLKLS